MCEVYYDQYSNDSSLLRSTSVDYAPLSSITGCGGVDWDAGKSDAAHPNVEQGLKIVIICIIFGMGVLQLM